MNSSVNKPLDFFEYITKESNFIEYTNQILNDSDFVSYQVIDCKTVKYTELDFYNNLVGGSLELTQIINPRLRKQLEITKELLKQFCTDNEGHKIVNYLRIQFNTIQSIINDNFEFINKYPHLILPLRAIVKFINDVLILPDTTPYFLNEEKVTTEIKDGKLVEKSTINLIHEIFDYFNGNNEKQEVILEEREFNLLIEHTAYLINEEKVPTIKDKITPNLKNGNILLSYWVLHKNIYTTQKIRPYFYDFIKALFTNFESSEIKSIAKQFGTKTYPRVSKFAFLPNIISDYLE